MNLQLFQLLAMKWLDRTAQGFSPKARRQDGDTDSRKKAQKS